MPTPPTPATAHTRKVLLVEDQRRRQAQDRAFLERLARPDPDCHRNKADLYEKSGVRVQLAIHNGNISVGSLAAPGFASGVAPEQVGRASSHSQAIKEYGT